MDELDKRLFSNLSNKIEIPNQYTYVINNALNNKTKIKKIEIRSMIKAIITFMMGVLLTGGVVFAATTTYEKIWKEPKKYDSYEEYQEKLKNDGKIYMESAVITDDDIEKVESDEQAKQKAAEVMELFGYDSSKIKTVELKKGYLESSKLTYVVRTSIVNYGIEVDIDAETGKFESFMNNDMMYNYNSYVPDKLEELEVKEYAKDIYQKLGYKEGVYEIGNIREKAHCFGDQSVTEWEVEYYKKGRYIANDTDKLVLVFLVENGKIKINNFAHWKDSEYQYQDNNIEITEEKAIEIAKEKDKIIADKEIEDINAELKIGRMNSFVYLQEQSQGTDDGTRTKQEGNTSITYNTYEETEKIARNVWSVWITYKKVEDYHTAKSNDEMNRMFKEALGRVYYVDATSGEIIGGSWGEMKVVIM